jgi:Flp pilus assembly protein TadG
VIRTRMKAKKSERMWRGVMRDTRGTEIAETAVVLPLVLIMLIAVFWFGQAFRIYGTLAHAAREGARAAVAPACATCAATTPTQNAAAAITKALTAAHLNTAQLVPAANWTSPQLYVCGTSPNPQNVQQCDPTVNTINICVQTNVQLSYENPLGAGGAGSCGTSVSLRYQYPYHFKLPCWPQPCTALDLYNVSLPGQAQMRLETQ